MEIKQHNGVRKLLTDEKWGTSTILTKQEHQKFPNILAVCTLQSCVKLAVTRTPPGSLDIKYYKNKHISKKDV